MNYLETAENLTETLKGYLNSVASRKQECTYYTWQRDRETGESNDKKIMYLFNRSTLPGCNVAGDIKLKDSVIEDLLELFKKNEEGRSPAFSNGAFPIIKRRIKESGKVELLRVSGIKKAEPGKVHDYTIACLPVAPVDDVEFI